LDSKEIFYLNLDFPFALDVNSTLNAQFYHGDEILVVTIPILESFPEEDIEKKLEVDFIEGDSDLVEVDNECELDVEPTLPGSKEKKKETLTSLEKKYDIIERLNITKKKNHPTVHYTIR